MLPCPQAGSGGESRGSRRRRNNCWPRRSAAAVPLRTLLTRTAARYKHDLLGDLEIIPQRRAASVAVRAAEAPSLYVPNPSHGMSTPFGSRAQSVRDFASAAAVARKSDDEAVRARFADD